MKSFIEIQVSLGYELTVLKNAPIFQNFIAIWVTVEYNFTVLKTTHENDPIFRLPVRVLTFNNNYYLPV